MAYHDSLTGLPNRARLNDRSEKVLSLAKANKTMFSVLFLDFDKFKPINDKFGHDMGDLLLKTVSERLSKAIRKQDILARIGGDEFILLLPDIREPENIPNIARKLNEIGRKSVNLNGNEVSISFSIGISLYPIDGEDMPTLMKKADDALYKAKSKGRDTYHISTPLDPDVSDKSNILVN